MSRQRTHEIRTLALAVMIALVLGVGTFLAGTALFAPGAPRLDSGTRVGVTRDMGNSEPNVTPRLGPPVSASVCALSQTQNDVGWRITIMVDGKAKTTTTHDYMAPCH
jgi:hypothetical protein